MKQFRSLEKLVEHVIDDLLGSGAIKFRNLVLFGTVGIESTKLTTGVPE